LAALHQLRGRIGRGTHQSYCILLTGDEDPEAQEKLRIMEQTHDGFVISEEDLRRRGPGDVLGQAQSGSAPLRFGDFLADTRLISLARTLAQRILSRDPKLEEPRWEDLRQVLLQAPAQGASAMQ
jgi:ATP-dependent DNA helicase RecG